MAVANMLLVHECCSQHFAIETERIKRTLQAEKNEIEENYEERK